MRRLFLLAALCMVLALMFASIALAQTRGPSGEDGTYNCEDFDDQGQAQEFFNGDPGDTNGLDADDDGIACEELPTIVDDGTPDGSAVPGSGESTTPAATATAGSDDGGSTTATATAEGSASVSTLPETGGAVSPALLSVVAGVMLVGGGLFSASVLRRG